MAITQLPWDDEYDGEWAKQVATWRWKQNGDVLRVEGNCPRCDHHMSREVEKADTAVRMLTPGGDGDEVERVTIRCNCTGAHQGRPKDQLGGCGRAAIVLLPLS